MMDDFDKQVRKDAMAGLDNTKVKKNKKAINKTTKKINKNLISAVIKPLAGKTPAGRVLKTLSNIGKTIGKKTGLDKEGAGALLVASVPTIPIAIDYIKDLKKKKAKKQKELATIEYGFDTKGVDINQGKNYVGRASSKFQRAQKERISRRKAGGLIIKGKSADYYKGVL